jgi:Oligosaccharyltransferase subunit Ribophorin II
VKLKAFVASDGTFLSSIGSKETSTQNARLALEVLAIFAADLSPNALETFANTALPLLPQGDDETPVNPTLLSPLSKISSKKPRLVGPRLVAVTESLLHLRHSDSLETVSDVLESLYFVMTYKASPVFITLRSPTIRADDFSKTLVVDVVDLFGNAAAVEAVEVRSIKRSGRDTVLFQGVLEGNSLDLSAIDGIVSGLFAAELSVTVTGQPKA